MKRIESDGKKGVKFIGSRKRKINPLERRHLRWNYECSEDSGVGVYNFVLYGSGAEVGAGKFFNDVFGDYGNSGLDVDFNFEIKKHNRFFFYNALRVFSTQEFNTLNFKEYSNYKIVSDKNLHSEKVRSIQQYVDELYAPKKK